MKANQHLYHTNKSIFDITTNKKLKFYNTVQFYISIFICLQCVLMYYWSFTETVTNTIPKNTATSPNVINIYVANTSNVTNIPLQQNSFAYDIDYAQIFMISNKIIYVV